MHKDGRAIFRPALIHSEFQKKEGNVIYSTLAIIGLSQITAPASRCVKFFQDGACTNLVGSFSTGSGICNKGFNVAGERAVHTFMCGADCN
jgi:hypothetical protein